MLVSNLEGEREHYRLSPEGLSNALGSKSIGEAGRRRTRRVPALSCDENLPAVVSLRRGRSWPLEGSAPDQQWKGRPGIRATERQLRHAFANNTTSSHGSSQYSEIAAAAVKAAHQINSEEVARELGRPTVARGLRRPRAGYAMPS